MVENINTLFGRLRLKQLNLIIAIGQHNSLRKAAAELAMTQSAASKALREAELILGDTLFERRRDGLYANQFGECAINYEIGSAHVCTPVTNAHLVCRLMLEKKKSLHPY